jgi:hypothetical protein
MRGVHHKYEWNHITGGAHPEFVLNFYAEF